MKQALLLFALFFFSCSVDRGHEGSSDALAMGDFDTDADEATGEDVGRLEKDTGNPGDVQNTTDFPTDGGGTKSYKLAKPLGNKIYHAAFPDFGGSEDRVSAQRILDFETLAGKRLTWAYFSNNWSRETGIHFPGEAVKTIHDLGRVPYIRLMARSSFAEGGPDPLLSIDVLLSGEKDEDLKRWARRARDTGVPLLAEFGTEVNGDWFPWNAKWNGGAQSSYGDGALFDGMEKFRDLYRKIILICRAEGADNITWFFHVDAYSSPKENWNTMVGYYPGDEYIDWIGVSIYGPQQTSEGWWSFQQVLDDSWAEIEAISPGGKPLAILEWGVVEGNAGQKAKWIKDGIATILPGGAYEKRFSAVSYWHENFDSSPLRIDTDPLSLSAYQKAIGEDIFVSEAVFE